MMMNLPCFIAGKKKSRFTRFHCVKFYCPKNWSCKFFDKFQVCPNARMHQPHTPGTLGHHLNASGTMTCGVSSTLP